MRAAFCGAQMLAGLLVGLAPPALAQPSQIAATQAIPKSAIAMHGAPALPDDFTALPYVNPDAPKAGRLAEGVLGTFDSLNPLIVQGLAVQPVRGYVIESLMARSYDEPFTLYGLLARDGRDRRARSYVTFTLDPAAHFLRRHAGNRRGRGVLLAASARSRPAQPPHLLFQGGEGGNSRCRAPCVSISPIPATANCR